MDEANRPGMSTAELLAETWRVWRSHAGMFVRLNQRHEQQCRNGEPHDVNFVTAPHAEGTPLREVWRGMGFLQKATVFVLFLGSFAMQYRAPAASVFATQEIRNGRSVGIFHAIRPVRRKQLRLFWMVMLAGILTGPLGLIVFPLLAFGFAPAFPAATLENMTAFAAIKRGDALAKGGHGRIALLVAMWLGLGIAAVFGWVSLLIMLEERFGRPWFLRPVPFLGCWLILLIPQWYMIALTLNYFEQRRRLEPVPEMEAP